MCRRMIIVVMRHSARRDFLLPNNKIPPMMNNTGKAQRLIDGLKERTLVALLASIETVMLLQRICDELELIPVSMMDEVLKIALRA